MKADRKEKLIDTITLGNIEGVGLARLYHLIGTFGSPGAVLRASVGKLADIPGIGRETASRIAEKQNRKAAEESVQRICRKQWKVFLYDDSDYPEPLKTIEDRPPYLFYQGQYNPLDFNAIAIIGARSGSTEGRLFTENLAGELAESGVTIVSGMARGIDTAAHRGALKAGGRTIAVFGSSLDIIYPPEGKKLAEQIKQAGCIFSEFLPNTRPDPYNFPRRNRIISGLSQGVVVVEAAARSGALSTASHAIAQNREVFAVPGSPRRRTSEGTNWLIKKGARLLTSDEDIFSELPRLKGKVSVKKAEKLDELTETEKAVLELFAEGPIHIDILSRKLETPLPDLMQILLALELKGLVKELSGKRYILD